MRSGGLARSWRPFLAATRIQALRYVRLFRRSHEIAPAPARRCVDVAGFEADMAKQREDARRDMGGLWAKRHRCACCVIQEEVGGRKRIPRYDTEEAEGQIHWNIARPHPDFARKASDPRAHVTTRRLSMRGVGNRLTGPHSFFEGQWHGDRHRERSSALFTSTSGSHGARSKSDAVDLMSMRRDGRNPRHHHSANAPAARGPQTRARHHVSPEGSWVARTACDSTSAIQKPVSADEL